MTGILHPQQRTVVLATSKFHSKLPDLNVAPYVLYIYSCYETRT